MILKSLRDLSYQRKLLRQIRCQRSQNTYVTVLYRFYDTETIRFFYGVDWLRCLMLTALTCNQKKKLIILKIIPNEILICLSLATVGRNTTLSALIADVWSGEFMLLIIIFKKSRDLLAGWSWTITCVHQSNLKSPWCDPSYYQSKTKIFYSLKSVCITINFFW